MNKASFVRHGGAASAVDASVDALRRPSANRTGARPYHRKGIG
jgi:hypothetical protein